MSARALRTQASGTRGALVLAWLVVVAFYVWTSWSNNLSWRFGEEQTDYYNLLVDGFLEGQLSLKAEVPPEILACANPYDPARRPAGLALHDASLYRGKYYIYYGVVPAAVLLWPFRVLTGIDLPLPAALLLLVIIGYTFSLALLGELRRAFFPRAGPVLLFGLAVGLGFAGCTAFLVRRSSMYELPIAGGTCFALAALYFLWRAVRQPERGWVAWMLSSTCWALAIGARPTYILAPLATVGALVVWWRWGGPRDAGLFRRRVLAVAAPLVAIGCLLALYNYARFGDPREFGVRYILSGVYEAEVEHFRLRYVPWNAFAYFLAPTQLTPTFPFLHPEELTLPRPRQHFGMDFPFGLGLHVPLLLLVALVPVAWRQGVGGERRELRAVVAALAWAAGSVLGLVLCFYAAMARYASDFAPTLALLAGIGALAVAESLAERPRLARGFAAAVLALVCFSAGIVFFFSVRIYDRVRAFNPWTFAALTRAAEAPVRWVERLRGAPEASGVVALELVFPAGATGGKAEDLIVSGRGSETDRVSVMYPDETHIQFGYEHAGARVLLSEPLACDRRAVHQVRVALGSLGASTRGADLAMNGDEPGERVRIEFDGRTVLERHQRFYRSVAADVLVGGAGERRFSGRVVSLTRFTESRPAGASGGVASAAGRELQADATGTFELALQFPRVAPVGTREPLIVSGETGRGNSLAVEYVTPDTVRFVFEHWGRQSYRGPLFRHEPGREYHVTVTHPFYAGYERSRRAVGADPLVVRVDGAVVWTLTPLYYPAARRDVFVGHDPIGGPGTAPRFTGTLGPWAQAAGGGGAPR